MNTRWMSDLKKAQTAADVGRQILLKYFGRVRHIDRKINQSLVSEADIESEKAIKQCLDDGTVSFLAEESGAEGEFNRKWVIDPLDGTTNYLHGLPFYAISIALEEDGEVVVALIDLPQMGSRYWSVKSQGAFKQTQFNSTEAIRVSERSEIHEALLATGFSTWEFDDLQAQLIALEKIIQQTRGIRRFGSAAMDLCLVAEGIFDGFWEKHLQAWDTAAGELLVREAGGVVTNFQNQFFHYNDATILASNGKIHETILALLQGVGR